MGDLEEDILNIHTNKVVLKQRLPDVILNSTIDVAVIAHNDPEHDLKLKYLSKLVHERIKRVTVCVIMHEEDKCRASYSKLKYRNLDYLNICMYDCENLPVPWLPHTILNSLATLNILILEGVSLRCFTGFRTGLEFSALKKLSLQYMNIPKQFFAISYPELEELFLRSITLAELPKVISPGFTKVKKLVVKGCKGDGVTKITQEIKMRSNSTL